MRWGPGPVFVYESITAARRWQHYALRAVFVLALLAGLAVVWAFLVVPAGRRVVTFRELAEVGRYFYYAIATVQLTVVLLAAPAATAGAICLDRARGSLTHVLVTDLTDGEIVLGKLAARLAPVVALVAASIPVLALAGLLGGIDVDALGSLALVTLAVAAFGCAAALAVSVRATKTHEVLTAVFAVWAFWLLGPVFLEILKGAGVIGRPADWFLKLNPYVLAWAPYTWPGYVGASDVALFLATTLGLSALLAGYAVFRLRAPLGEASGPRRRAPGVLGRVGLRLGLLQYGPSLDAQPVLWREWRRARPSRLARVVWGVFVALSVAGSCLGCFLVFTDHDEEYLVMASSFHVMLGLVLVSLAAPTALAEERAQGSLDVLMTTPLSTAAIVAGKWWGAYRVVPKLAILPAIGMIVLASEFPETLSSRLGRGAIPITALDRVAVVVIPAAWVLAQGAVVTSLGLLLATWIPRLGRAVALSVSLQVVFSFGWPVLLELGVEEGLLYLLGFEGVDLRQGVSMLVMYGLLTLCPFGGQFAPYVVLSDSHDFAPLAFWLVEIAGISFTTGVAALLLGLTLLSFDRRLGRAPERPRRAARPPRRLAAPRADAGGSPAPDLAAVVR